VGGVVAVVGGVGGPLDALPQPLRRQHEGVELHEPAALGQPPTRKVMKNRGTD